MICAVKQAVPLLLLLAAATVISTGTDQKCDGVNKMLPKEDLHKIFGHWVLVWSVSDNPHAWDMFPNISSSHVEFRLLADNKTVVFTESNLQNNVSCTVYTANMSINASESDHHRLITESATVHTEEGVQPFNDMGVIDLYESCPDCMVLDYKSNLGRFLLTYKREGHHSDVEALAAAHKHHQLRSECFGYPSHQPFIYDSVSRFCDRKSSVSE
ncbi:hypothetical protein JOB18_004783 [Solea senegalensis]|uniref:Uncharacterized protein n=1 Tax=Solea senegalensis TaxID=28829 RepID=A0AAV6T3F0_SOLSE|nr:saxitoxin and tetrodotoxin-binding protein 1-like [Solea senegalensis]KAG7523936.1 hypothetical protein JOB18_004783 [Solea senegalensis]